MSQFYSLKVDRVERETVDTVSVYFEIPSDLEKQFSFKAGQYITLKFDFDGEEHRRSYSLSTSPHQKEFGVTVKEVSDGFISKHLNQKVKAGDHIDVMPPEGRFTGTWDHDKRREIFLIGAGSGITPLMSIIRTVLEEEPMSKVHLLYGSRDENQIIFKSALDELIEKYDGQFTADHMISSRAQGKKKFLGGLFKKGSLNWESKAGRIDEKVIMSCLDEHSQGDDRLFFICGPGEMIKTAETALIKMGVDSKSIMTEYFVSASDVPAESSVDAVHGGMTVHLNGNTIQLPIKDKSILDTLLDADYDAPYSCHSGACATCMAKLIKGTAEMDVCFALDDDEIENGFILTCQAHPTSKEIEVSFDV